jgi:hypothetical protein
MRMNIPQVKQEGFNPRGVANPRDIRYTPTKAYRNNVTSHTMNIPKNKR